MRGVSEPSSSIAAYSSGLRMLPVLRGLRMMSTA
jgi:hypothetical protein